MGTKAPQKPPTDKTPWDARRFAGHNPPAPRDRPEPPDPPPPPPPKEKGVLVASKVFERMPLGTEGQIIGGPQDGYGCVSNGSMSVPTDRIEVTRMGSKQLTEFGNCDCAILQERTFKVPCVPLTIGSPHDAINSAQIPKMGSLSPAIPASGPFGGLTVQRRAARWSPEEDCFVVTVGYARATTEDVLRDIERPPQMLGYEDSPWPFADVSWPTRKWLAAYLALAGVLWAFAEIVR